MTTAIRMQNKTKPTIARLMFPYAFVL